MSELSPIQVQRPRPKELGRLRSYNQFPLHYENIPAMTADLPRIKSMGFSNVWVNPLFEPCQSMEAIAKEVARGLDAVDAPAGERKMDSKPGSPYATRSFDINTKISANTDEVSPELRRQKDYADIRRYTEEANKLGLTPMYDFVMRHVAVDNPVVERKPHWFKRHDNGNYKFFGRDEHYRAKGQSWDDVLELNYDDPKVRREIVEEYLKPMADIVIGQFGFQGLRIDAAGTMPRELYAEILPYIDELSMKKHGKPAIVMGETLGQNVNDFMHLGGHMDCVYNSVYYQPFVKEHWAQDHSWFADTKGRLQEAVGPTVGFAGNHDVVRLADYYLNKHHIRGDLLREVISAGCINGDIPQTKVLNIFTSLNDKQAFEPGHLKSVVDAAVLHIGLPSEEAHKIYQEIDEKGKLKQQYIKQWFQDHPVESDVGGQRLFKSVVDTMFSVVKREKEKETHEMREYGERKTKKLVSETDFIRLIPGKLDETRLKRLIKEAMCFVAFASDGGWFLSLGDEFGVTKRTNVFTASPEDIKQRAYPDLDFSEHIRSMNAVLAQLPPPAHPEWVQRCYLEDPVKNKNLSSFLIHQGHGFEGTCHLVIANVSEEKQVVDYETFMDIKQANGRNRCPGKEGMPMHVYLCGDVELSPNLRVALEQKGVTILDSKKSVQQQDGADIKAKSANRFKLPEMPQRHVPHGFGMGL